MVGPVILVGSLFAVFVVAAGLVALFQIVETLVRIADTLDTFIDDALESFSGD